jgi:hypothetical protein
VNHSPVACRLAVWYSQGDRSAGGIRYWKEERLVAAEVWLNAALVISRGRDRGTVQSIDATWDRGWSSFWLWVRPAIDYVP